MKTMKVVFAALLASAALFAIQMAYAADVATPARRRRRHPSIGTPS